MAIIGQLAFTQCLGSYCYQAICGTTCYAIVRNYNNTSPNQLWVALVISGAGSVIGSYSTFEGAVNACQTNLGSAGQLKFVQAIDASAWESILGPAADTYLVIRGMLQSTVPLWVAVTLGASPAIIGTYSGRMLAFNACQVNYNALST